MEEPVNVGIIICDRYRRCAGGKCMKSLHNREGAFERYTDSEVKLVGYTTCDGCPGGNIEYAVGEMKNNGATVIHLATGLIVGYPPCPYVTYFRSFIENRYQLEVVYGTHPIPEKYLTMHTKLGTWEGEEWKQITNPTMSDEPTRLAYN